MNYEILPTEENLINMLKENQINRNEDLALFNKLLYSQDGPSSIAIDGRWGSGKTFFVKQSQLIINANNPCSSLNEDTRYKITSNLSFLKEQNDNNGYELAIYFDAWENDNDKEPIVAIIYEIAKQLGIEYKIKDNRYFGLAATIIDFISGRNVTNVYNALKESNPLNELKKQNELKENIKEFIKQSIEEKGNRLVIFVDELDRCKPSYAVHLLEQIKHYLCVDNVTFVFSVNLEELQHTVKHYYGENFDACRYLDRFFDLRISLPKANMQKYYNSINLNGSHIYEEVCRRVIEMYNFELREIAHFYMQAKASAYKPTHNSEREIGYFMPDRLGEQLIMDFIVPLLIGLKMVSISEYDKFINGNNPKPLHDLLDSESTSYFIFGDLLNNDESLNQETSKKIVTKSELIDRFYNAIFAYNYSEGRHTTLIGKYSFDRYSKDFAIRVASELSEYAEY